MPQGAFETAEYRTQAHLGQGSIHYNSNVKKVINASCDCKLSKKQAHSAFGCTRLVTAQTERWVISSPLKWKTHEKKPAERTDAKIWILSPINSIQCVLWHRRTEAPLNSCRHKICGTELTFAYQAFHSFMLSLIFSHTSCEKGIFDTVDWADTWDIYISCGMPVQVPTLLLPTQLPAHASWETASYGSKTWIPATYMEGTPEKEFKAPGFMLVLVVARI